MDEMRAELQAPELPEDLETLDSAALPDAAVDPKEGSGVSAVPAGVAEEGSRPGGSEEPGLPPAPTESGSPMTTEPEPAPAAAVEAAAALALEDQLQRIRAMDPGVRGWEDIVSGPRAADFHRLVRQGCTPVEAFQVTQFERIVGRRVAAARRSALHAAYGKAHLRATSAAMGDDLAVPPDVERQYRAFFPDWSDAQIRSDYSRRR